MVANQHFLQVQLYWQEKLLWQRLVNVMLRIIKLFHKKKQYPKWYYRQQEKGSFKTLGHMSYCLTLKIQVSNHSNTNHRYLICCISLYQISVTPTHYLADHVRYAFDLLHSLLLLVTIGIQIKYGRVGVPICFDESKWVIFMFKN